MADSIQPLVCQSKDGYAVVSFPKEMARAHLTDIRDAGEKIIDDLSKTNQQHCLVDLSQLDYIGSSLVAAIVRIWKAISERDGQMVVVASNIGTREVLKVTGLNKVWTIAPNLEAGVHALGFSKEAKVVKRERRILVMVGAFSLLCGIVAVAIRVLPRFEELGHPADFLVYSILGLSLATSGISIFREKGWRLWLTVIVFLASVPLLGFFIWHNEYRGTGFPVPVESALDPYDDDDFFNETLPSTEPYDSPEDAPPSQGSQAPQEDAPPSAPTRPTNPPTGSGPPVPVDLSITPPESQGSQNENADTPQSQTPSSNSNSRNDQAPGDE